MLWRLYVCLAHLIAFTAVPANAIEVMGRMTAFLDGERRDWQFISFRQSNRGIATASFRQGSDRADLHLQGHSETHFTNRGALSVEARYAGVYRADADPIWIEILYMPEGLGGPFWTSNGARIRPRLDILAFDIWGTAGRIEAVFSGQICMRPMISAKTDPTNCRTISGQAVTEIAVQ